MKRRIDDLGFLLLIVMSVLTLLYICVPIMVSIAMSFDARNFLGPFPPGDFSLRWYQGFFSNAYFMRALVSSLQIAVLSTIVTAVLGGAAALALNSGALPGHRALMAFFLSPLMVPGVVIGFGLLMLLTQFLGITNGFVRIVIGHVVISLPYMVRATLGGLTGIKPSLREAALVLGASERQAFWDVTFPLARTGMIVGCIFAFTLSLDDVAVALFLYDPDTVTLPVALLTYMRASFDLTVAAATVFLAGTTLLLILLLDRVVGLDRIVGQGVYRS